MSRSDFWSRRKAAVAEEEAADEATVDTLPQTPEPEGEDALSDEELLAKYELPDPDTLEEGDDFSAFMSSAIPERLRNRALRKLWLTNPTLANVDGLVEYGEDYTDAATVVENLQTVYQIGKGMIKDLLEDEEDEETGEPEDEAAEPEVELAEETPAIPDDSAQISPEPELALYEPEQAEMLHAPATRPRMRFSFPQDG